ncbi:unnamed protein product [Schistosoma mattheei]|uniref:Uncharacterized protein n=1 Tax=Schistosoma mattheei TaxID=31246 RepID=A0A3P8KVN6_9TREM|nr:unnamed protein product [Schistosoma mattheei]
MRKNVILQYHRHRHLPHHQLHRLYNGTPLCVLIIRIHHLKIQP